ncbi:MAG: gliding motility-associated C-terminal domain-containing protein, partial [Bacteroidota bacterium]
VSVTAVPANATATVNIAENEIPAIILANADNAGPIAGVNQIITVLNVLDNDKFNGGNITLSQVSLTQTVADPTGYMTLKPDGTIELASNTPEGTYTLTYQLCETGTIVTNCDDAIVTVIVEKPIINITAQPICINDVPYISYTATPVNFTPVNGLTITWADSSNNVVTTMTNLPLSGNVLWPGATVDINGNGTDWPGWVFANNQWIQAADGFESLIPSATLTFELNPTETIVVNYPTPNPLCKSRPTFEINAFNDTVGPINGVNGATNVLNVYNNDKLNTLAVNPSDVTLTVVTPDPTGALTLNPNGSIDVKAGTYEGTYSLTYQICENADDGNCDTATVQVTVDPSIDAVNDIIPPVAGGISTTIPSLFGNDTLNGSSFTASQVTLTTLPIGGGILMNFDGTITVPANTPSGTYPVTYTICTVAKPGICDTVTTTLVVNPSVEALDDTTTTAPSGVVTTVPTVFQNDTVNGSPFIQSQITLTTDPIGGGIVMNADGTITVPANAPSGTYPVTYTICTVATPIACSKATRIVVVAENPSIAIVKTATFNDENGDGFAQANETISYAFTITNTGNTALSSISVEDPLPGLVITGGPISLAVGQTNDTAFTATYPITQDDINLGSVTNQAVATGTSLLGTVVSDLSDDSSILGDQPTVVNVSGCVIEIFNAMTLNNDPKNDRFYIRGLECYPQNTVEIYNRWGVIVFERSGYNNSDRVFKGLSEGRVTINQAQELPAGTYFYILRYTDNTSVGHEKSGYLYISR